MHPSAILPEFLHEFAQTRRILERVPGERFDWKPHAKSSSLGDLALHLVDITKWVPYVFDRDHVDLTAIPPDDTAPATTEALLERFDSGMAEARSAFDGASPESMDDIWTLKAGEDVIFSLPRSVALRGFILNHNVHHRAQLGVYLRLLDVPVPAIYGPSADEER